MERRDFLKKSLLAGLTTGAVLSMGKFGKIYSAGNLANIGNAENMLLHLFISYLMSFSRLSLANPMESSRESARL